MSTSKYDSVRRVFTANFRMLMQAAEWTQMEAAAELGISQGSVSDFWSGKRVPSMKGIESIAYRLGIPAEAFVTKRIGPELMRKVLSGKRPLKVVESSGVYRAAKPYDPWLVSLKQRWQRNPATHDDTRIAVRILFGRQARDVIKWLQRD